MSQSFEDEGIITLDGPNRMEILSQVESGTVILPHTGSPEVRKLARDKGLTTLDATCPDVTKTHDLIREKARTGMRSYISGRRDIPSRKAQSGLHRIMCI